MTGCPNFVSEKESGLYGVQARMNDQQGRYQNVWDTFLSNWHDATKRCSDPFSVTAKAKNIHFVLKGKVKTGSITIGSVYAYDLPLSRNKKCIIKKIQLIPKNNLKIGNSKIKRAVFWKMPCGTLLTQKKFPKLKISIMFNVNTFSLSEWPYPIVPKSIEQDKVINARHSELIPNFNIIFVS